jgi:hypothetical protein
MDTDRNLMFGVLALQMELVDARQFADACAGWAARKDTTLADLMVERHWITPEAREKVERLLEHKLHSQGSGERTLVEIRDDSGDTPSASGVVPPAHDTVVIDGPKAEGGQPRYVLTRLFAEGGLGRIYIARDQDLNRDVALKEIKPQHSRKGEASRRFLKEAQVTGQLEHPNIVPVY